MLVPIVCLISVFTFVSVAVWADSRRREREAFYRHETYRKILEGPEPAGRAVLHRLREEDVQRERARVEGLRLGGLLSVLTGIGTMVFLYYLVTDVPVYWVGLVPILAGVGLLAYGYRATSAPELPAE